MYKFGDVMILPKIPTSDWIEYIVQRFETTGKRISKELAEAICNLVENHSSYVQQLSWLVWIQTDGETTEHDFQRACQDLIDQNSLLFERQTENLSSYQMNFLRALVDGFQSEFTTAEMLNRYQLGSSANVSIIKKALVKKDLIENENKMITLVDPVMKVWLRQKFLKT